MPKFEHHDPFFYAFSAICFPDKSNYQYRMPLNKHVGFSFHDTPELLDQVLTDHPFVDFVQLQMPNFHQYLPVEIQKFTIEKGYDPLNHEESLKKTGPEGHHGSHPHLVHEFVTSIVENRKPWIDEVLGGNITAAGICAHESAMKNGEFVTVPEF